MKTSLKMAVFAIFLLTPASSHAAGALIDQNQEAQQEPQRIPDPVEFFDKRTGNPKVWYWRAESGYDSTTHPAFTPARARFSPLSRGTL